jgi:hypothetical protein
VLLTACVPVHRSSDAPRGATVRPSMSRIGRADPGSTRSKSAKGGTCFILGSEGGLTYGIVDANLSFETGERGTGWAKCIVGVSIDNNRDGVCFARTCRGTLASRINGLCPHQETLLSRIRSAPPLPGETVGTGDPGLILAPNQASLRSSFLCEQI